MPSTRVKRNTARSKAATKSDKPRRKPTTRKKEEPSNRDLIRKEEQARRDQKYTVTLTAHQRALLIRRLEVIGSARTKNEEELMDMLRSLKPDGPSGTRTRRKRAG